MEQDDAGGGTCVGNGRSVETAKWQGAEMMGMIKCSSSCSGWSSGAVSPHLEFRSLLAPNSYLGFNSDIHTVDEIVSLIALSYVALSEGLRGRLSCTCYDRRVTAMKHPVGFLFGALYSRIRKCPYRAEARFGVRVRKLGEQRQ
jgi:hypothetical protein